MSRIVVAALLLFGAARAEASFDILNVVAVPMENGDEGTVELRYMTVWLSYTSAWPGVEVMYTCAAAPVQRRMQKMGQAAEQEALLVVEDENVAHRMGLTVEVEDRYDGRTWNSPHSVPPGARWGSLPEWPKEPYVDTLRVQ